MVRILPGYSIRLNFLDKLCKVNRIQGNDCIFKKEICYCLRYSPSDYFYLAAVTKNHRAGLA